MYKVIMTAGGTSEKIDNVRKITNSSSGKLGSVIASRLLGKYGEKIERVYYICSKTAIRPLGDKVEVVEVFDTADLEREVKRLLTENNIDYFIHSMAVSDYAVDYVTTAERLAETIEEVVSNTLDVINNFDGVITDNKISSNLDNLIIKLKRTPKIISMIKAISPKTYLVGFKLLDGVSEVELLNTAIKLKEKNDCDLVVANDLDYIRKGEHRAFVAKGVDDYVVASGKEDIADKVIEEMMRNERV